MLSLRTADGLDLVQFRSYYGVAAEQKALAALQPYVHRGLVEVRYSCGSSGGCGGEGEVVDSGQSDDIYTVTSGGGVDSTAAAPSTATAGAAAAVSVRLIDPDGFLLPNDIISSVFAACSS